MIFRHQISVEHVLRMGVEEASPCPPRPEPGRVPEATGTPMEGAASWWAHPMTTGPGEGDAEVGSRGWHWAALQVPLNPETLRVASLTRHPHPEEQRAPQTKRAANHISLRWPGPAFGSAAAGDRRVFPRAPHTPPAGFAAGVGQRLGLPRVGREGSEAPGTGLGPWPGMSEAVGGGFGSVLKRCVPAQGRMYRGFQNVSFSVQLFYFGGDG